MDVERIREATRINIEEMKRQYKIDGQELALAMTVKLAEVLPGCMEALKYSHTCYKGESPPCGHCHACLLRQRGFDEAGIKDPLKET